MNTKVRIFLAVLGGLSGPISMAAANASVGLVCNGTWGARATINGDYTVLSAQTPDANGGVLQNFRITKIEKQGDSILYIAEGAQLLVSPAHSAITIGDGSEWGVKCISEQ